MKKLLAVLLAMTMVLVMFAACGSTTTEETTTAEETTSEEITETEATEAEETSAADETAEAADTTAADGETTAADGETTAADGETTAKEEVSVPQTTEEIVAYYNAAVKKTNDAGKTAGKSTMKLDGEITADGAIGGILSVVQPIIKSTLEKNSSDTDSIPGQGNLKASDVTSAKATEKNGVITIEIKLKEQTDGYNADKHDGGPVARGITTLGSVDTALDELGGSIEEGKDNIKLTYKDAYIKCNINEKTGKITSGTWHYLVDINISSAKLNIKIGFSVKNMHGAVDYTVTV